MTSPFIPCSFTYGDAPQGGSVIPTVLAGRNPSDTVDIQYQSGYLWLSDLAQGGSGTLYYQAGNTVGTPNWTSVGGGGGGALNTLSDGSTTVNPVAGNISLRGTANQITVTSDAPAHSLIFSVPAVFNAPGSVTAAGLLTANAGLTVTAGGATVTGNSTITGDLNVTGTLSAGSESFAGLTILGNASINTSGAGTTTIGGAAATGAIIIDAGTSASGLQIIGNGNATGILIGNDAAANRIVIGNVTPLTAVHIESGTGNLLIDGAVTGTITLGNASQTGLITVGNSTAGQNVSISSAGTTAGTAEVDIMNGVNTVASTVKILSGNCTNTATLSLANGAFTGAHTQTVNLFNGITTATNSTQRLSIFSTTAASTLQEFDLFNGANSNTTNTVNIAGAGATGTAVAINIGTGAAAHVVGIGSSAAGAVSIASGLASSFTVTGAAADLTLSSVGGSVNVTGSEAINDAIVLNASDASGGVQIKAGTGGILIGDQATCSPIDVGNIAPTASRTITIGGGTVVTAAVTDTINIGPGGATTNANSIKTVDINIGGVTTGQVLTNIASGAVTSGTHTTSIATGNRAAGTMVLNLMTGTGTKTLSAGNADGLTTINLLGVVDINDSQNSNTKINTGTSTGTIGIGNSLAGAITVATAAGVGIDAATVSHFTVTGAAADLTLSAVGGSVNITATESVADAIVITASTGAGGIQMTAGTGNLTQTGIILKPTNPAFLTYLASTASNKTGTGTAYTLGTDVLTEVFDRGANASTAGVFTAPVTGIYDLRSQITCTGCTIATTFVITIVTTARSYINTFIRTAGAQDESLFVSSLCDMTATDTAHVTIAVTGEGADTVDILGAASAQTYFCGTLVA